MRMERCNQSSEIYSFDIEARMRWHRIEQNYICTQGRRTRAEVAENRGIIDLSHGFEMSRFGRIIVSKRLF